MREYRYSDIKEHFQEAVHIFGRWVHLIYDGQPDRKRKPNNTPEVSEENESAQQNNKPSHTTLESSTTTDETSESQLPTPTTINEIPQKETQPNTNSPSKTTPNNVRSSIVNEVIRRKPNKFFFFFYEKISCVQKRKLNHFWIVTKVKQMLVLKKFFINIF